MATKTTIENNILILTDNLNDGDSHSPVVESHGLDLHLYTSSIGTTWRINNLAALVNCLLKDDWEIEFKTQPYAVSVGSSVDERHSKSSFTVSAGDSSELVRWHRDYFIIQAVRGIYGFATGALLSITARKHTGFDLVDDAVDIPTISITADGTIEHKLGSYNRWSIIATTPDTRYLSTIFETYSNTERLRYNWEPDLLINPEYTHSELGRGIGSYISSIRGLYSFLIEKGIYAAQGSKSSVAKACKIIEQGDSIVVQTAVHGGISCISAKDLSAKLVSHSSKH